MNQPHRIREHVVSGRTDFNDQWPALRRRMARRKTLRRTAVACSIAVVFLALGSTAWFATRHPPQLKVGEWARTQDRPQHQLQLLDGSTLELKENAAVYLTSAKADSVSLTMASGRVSFSVSKKPQRAFIISLDDVLVRVVGTKFTIDRTPADTEVEVEEGIVEVTSEAGVARLTAGQHWSKRTALRAPTTDQPADESESDAANERDLDSVQSADSVIDPTRTPPPVRRPKERRRSVKTSESRAMKQPVAAVAEVEEAETEAKPASPPASDDGASATTEKRPLEKAAPEKPAAKEANPADVFASAMRARSQGRPDEAILLFQQVAERWPQSAFAPMSSFEWGRLALDERGDARAAAKAFQRTLDLATSPSLVEDALARLTEAASRFDAKLCEHTRTEYLKRFPNGTHIKRATKACQP